MTPYYSLRTQSSAGEGLRLLLAELLKEAGVRKPYATAKSNGQPVTGVEVHPWRSGNLRLLGLHRNYTLNLGNSGDDNSWDQKALRGPLDLKVEVGSPAALYDSRRGQFLGKQTHWVVTLNDTELVILSSLPEPVKGLSIEAPERARAGDRRIASTGWSNTRERPYVSSATSRSERSGVEHADSQPGRAAGNLQVGGAFGCKSEKRHLLFPSTRNCNGVESRTAFKHFVSRFD
jgi:hypothetical protein